MDEPEKRSGSGRSGTTTKDYLFLGAVFFLLATVQKQKKKKKLINCAIFNGRQRCARQIPSPPPLQHHRSIDPCGGSQVHCTVNSEKRYDNLSLFPLYTLAIKTQVCSSTTISGARLTMHTSQPTTESRHQISRWPKFNSLHGLKQKPQHQHSTMTAQITDRCCAAEEKRRRKNVRSLCLAAANKKDEEAPDFD